MSGEAHEAKHHSRFVRNFKREYELQRFLAESTMDKKRGSTTVIGALVVVAIGAGLAWWVMSGTETAPPVPPDRGNTEESLPAGPADPRP